MKNMQMARFGEANGMFWSQRTGLLNPNFGGGAKIAGKNNVMKNPVFKERHALAVSSKEHKEKLSEKSKQMWKRLKQNKSILQKRNKLISEANKGKIFSKETREKMSFNMRGRVPWNKGKNHFFDKRIFFGINHPRFIKGNIRKYPLEFSSALRELIRERDQFACRECNASQFEIKTKLHVHHIDYDKNNISLDNLISLCRKCHLRTNVKREFWKARFGKMQTMAGMPKTFRRPKK